MQLAHAGYNHLAGISVRADPKRRILYADLFKGDGQFLFVSLRLRLDGDTDHRLREVDTLEKNTVSHLAQGIAGGGKFESDHGSDIPGVQCLHLFPFVGMHQQDTSYFFLLAFARVVNLAPDLQDT